MAEQKKILLRIGHELHDALKTWAEAELRSVNGQIEYILREAVLRRGMKLEKPPRSEKEGGEPEEK